MSLGQFAASTQFYIVGKATCTKTGWEKAIQKYKKPDILADPRLSVAGHVYIVTGANAGIGKEIATQLARRGATVYMVCRNLAKAEKARDEISHIAKSSSVHVLQCDCSLESDVRNLWENFKCSQNGGKSCSIPNDKVRLDGLVCNAGAILSEKIFTSEGVETTFATHLLYGTYLLGSLAMESLEATEGSRIVVVSSGSMYNTHFPHWDDATSTGNKKYDGQYVYAYAKRGQVLLCERWATEHPKVKIVSCHPGWTLTDGVKAAYGDKRSSLEPMRSLWQGAEGIIWLCLVDSKELKSGEFYLDRSTQSKHMSGPIAGTYTKNSASDVNNMMSKLNQWSIGNRPSVEESTILSALKAPLTATTVPIDIMKFMGKWHVVANIPLSLELGASNYLESYSWNPKTETINVLCEYIALGGIPTTPKSCSKMHAKIMNAPINSYWALNPKVLGVYLPIGLTFLILDVAEDGSYALIGVPNRQNLWVLTRLKPTIKEGGQYKKIASTMTDEGSVAEATVFDDDSDERNSLPLGPVREASELDLEMEDAIMWRALAKARELGYDDERVLAVKWTV